MEQRALKGIARTAWGLAGAFLLIAATAASNPTLLFLTTTAECSCTLDRCTVGRQEIDKFLRAVPAKCSLQVIDVSKVPEATKTYRTLVLPTAILRGPTGIQIARFDGFFTEADLLGAWTRHLSAKEKKP
ncbi:MAG: hypothetical protein HZB55_20605 [Deltaproteobacteria bacterium]|nr:hypothetical protein [Deltaproteobacteria bacterium]